MYTVTKLIKIGNSYGIIIPKLFLDNLGWTVGTVVNVEAKNGDIVISEVKKKK